VWQDKLVSEAVIREIYALMKFGPTSANCCPARFLWLLSAEGKQRLSTLATSSNRPKILQAPVTVIIGYDKNFSEELALLLPHAPLIAEIFRGDPTLAETTAFRNSSLQGAYLMVAARALGLDCGPMSGFDNAAVDAEFFAGTCTKSNFICSFGYGVDVKLVPRNPRLEFERANTFA